MLPRHLSAFIRSSRPSSCKNGSPPSTVTPSRGSPFGSKIFSTTSLTSISAPLSKGEVSIAKPTQRRSQPLNCATLRLPVECRRTHKLRMKVDDRPYELDDVEDIRSVF